MVIVGAALAILITIVATPYRALIGHEYPKLNDSEPQIAQFALDPPQEKTPESRIVDDENTKTVRVEVPLRISGRRDRFLGQSRRNVINNKRPKGKAVEFRVAIHEQSLPYP